MDWSSRVGDTGNNVARVSDASYFCRQLVFAARHTHIILYENADSPGS
jgi:hypothetical protein